MPANCNRGFEDARTAEKFFHRSSTNDQKEHCVNACTELKTWASKVQNLYFKIIKDDTCWIYE